ncbi:Alanine dehydrogenase (plasmid) [Caballeronia sp. SBC1]|uniref:ornithine cyclodeaminase family protein n=1 Tax=unclassified Caballeronia TaxID=2646786 RepID=UPI0013E1B1DD|nr:MULTISPECIES: ornithine cyclodeaminase family protein [unclassified Caballeronia]QIE27132.1 Alanine dehydrogenase [Caballeronia sp. SBC2]QIN65391.1 Alanine dehydrogenase [Caballeronia sp. SBC1]
MNFYTNEEVRSALSAQSAIDALRDAYLELAHGDAAVQVRSRIAIPTAKFSTMSAMLGSANIAAVKMYTTLDGQFSFFVALMSLDDGRLLAMMEADALTRFRTAATTALAAQHLARPASKSIGIFGSGVQASAHAEMLISRFAIEDALIRSNDIESAERLAVDLRQRFNVRVSLASAEEAAGSDIVVLATRSSTPVMRGMWLKPGSFIAAIGATRPDQREMDDETISRSTDIVVDWLVQTPAESGDLALAPPTLLATKKITDLCAVIEAGMVRRDDCADIVVYKAVGMALQDAAIANLVHLTLGKRTR